MVSVTDPYGSILGFLDRSRYFFYQVAPQLYSRGWVDPVSDPLLFLISLDDTQKREFLTLPGLELRILGRSPQPVAIPTAILGLFLSVGTVYEIKCAWNDVVGMQTESYSRDDSHSEASSGFET
jgi:hypothetical protein